MSKKKPIKEPLPTDPKADALVGKVQTEDQDKGATLKIESPNPVDPAAIKTVDQPKPAINTQRAAEVVAAGSTSTGVGGGALLRAAVVFGGSAGAIKDDVSATTKEDAPYRAGSRTGKRIDPITRKLDTALSEQFRTEIRESKPLSETDAKQGYNGNYFNEHAITQKVSGGSPADPLFERSVDVITLDSIYFPQGQLIRGGKQARLSIHSWDVTNNNGYEQNPRLFQLGNYLPRKLILHITASGLSDMQLVSDDISPRMTDEAVTRLAGDSYLRFLNQSELDRNTMISVAGNESDPKWSCLGDAIIDPSDQNRLLRLMEATFGDFLYMGARNIQYAKSFQINKAAKDGLRLAGPMAEMSNRLVPLNGYGWDTAVDEEHGYEYTFSADAYVKGGAGLYIAINDSLPKYTTKGKMLTLPLSYGSAIATGLSNIDPFIMDSLLVDLCNKNELFSTIDGPYDPLKPVIITDVKGIAPLIDPFIGGVRSGNVTTFDDSSDFVVYVMHYENLRNKYNIRIKNYLAEGLWNYFSDRADRLWHAVSSKAVSGTATIEIPVASCVTGFSLWDLFLLQATPYMVESRLTTLTELLKYEKNFGYPYSGVIHLKDADVTGAQNFSFSDSDNMLSTAIATPVAAMKVVMPEVFWPVSKFEAQGSLHHNGIGALVVLPHYFVQNQFQYDQVDDFKTNAFLLSDEGATMAYPSIRTGSNLSYADTVYGMTEEDYRLSLDRMVVYPGYDGTMLYNGLATNTKIAQARGAGDQNRFQALTYKYGLSSDGQPAIPYFAYASDADNKAETLTIADVLSTPREIGYYMISPAGVLAPTHDAGGLPNYVDITSSYLGLSGPSFSARIYASKVGCMQNEILQQEDIDISANAAFKNQWTTICATPFDVDTDFGITLGYQAGSIDMAPFTAGAYAPTYGQYDPSSGSFAGNEEQYLEGTGSSAKGVNVHSTHKAMWTRLQRLPFIVNPFDVNTDDLTTVDASAESLVGESINDNDIFDFMYIFGLCGYRASDYSQLIYDRNRERIAKGMNYVTDPFADKSMLLK